MEHVTAVVLRAVPYRDADVIATLYVRELGKVSALARGGRRSRKRFGGALDLFTVSDVDLLPPRRGELWTWASAEPRRQYIELASDIAALAHASYATELVRELTVAEQPDPDLFDSLIELFDVIAGLGVSVSALRAFELRLLGCIGLAPMLNCCVACGTDDEDALDAGRAVLDPTRGGVLCEACAPAARSVGVRVLAPGVRRLLLAVQRSDSIASAHDRGEPPPPGSRDARDVLVAIILGHVGKPLRSLEFIAKLGGGAGTGCHSRRRVRS